MSIIDWFDLDDKTVRPVSESPVVNSGSPKPRPPGKREKVVVDFGPFGSGSITDVKPGPGASQRK